MYARKSVEEQFAEKMRTLDEEQAEQAKRLRHDPAALAKFLVRVRR